MNKFFTIVAVLLISISLVFIATKALASGDGSEVCPGPTASDISGTGDLVSYTGPAGSTINGVCIKSGSNMFGGNKHSAQLGNGTYETNCYTVSGVGTQTVTVTRIGSGSSCQEISHIDVFYSTTQTSPTPTLALSPTLTLTPTLTITPTPTEVPDEDKVTLCHATGSQSNPFEKITVDAAGAYNGHLGASHQNGEDIIPPFEYQGNTYSQNWPSGQATFDNNCVPTQTTITPTPTGTTTNNPGGPGDGLSDGRSDGRGGSSQGPTQAVLGLSTTSAGGNIYLSLVQLIAAMGLAATGFKYFRKNA